jgi:hypothetical protein
MMMETERGQVDADFISACVSLDSERNPWLTISTVGLDLERTLWLTILNTTIDGSLAPQTAECSLRYIFFPFDYIVEQVQSRIPL